MPADQRGMLHLGRLRDPVARRAGRPPSSIRFLGAAAKRVVDWTSSGSGGSAPSLTLRGSSTVPRPASRANTVQSAGDLSKLVDGIGGEAAGEGREHGLGDVQSPIARRARTSAWRRRLVEGSAWHAHKALRQVLACAVRAKLTSENVAQLVRTGRSGRRFPRSEPGRSSTGSAQAASLATIRCRSSSPARVPAGGVAGARMAASDLRPASSSAASPMAASGLAASRTAREGVSAVGAVRRSGLRRVRVVCHHHPQATRAI